MRANLLIMLLVTASVGCNSQGGAATNEGQQGAGAPSHENGAETSAETAQADFSSPQACVETFFAAAAAQDVETLSQCFAADAPGEFAALRDKTTSENDLAELVQAVDGSKVLGVENLDEGKGTAVVKATFAGRDEEISVVRVDGEWLILDF